MANLETLELRISANAQEATRGLGELISSLGSLSDALIKPYADLRDFNEELKKLKSMSKIKITIEGNQAIKQAKATAKKIQEAVIDMSQNNGRGGDSIHVADPAKDAEWARQLKENTAAYMAQREEIRKNTIAARERMAAEKEAAANAVKTRMQEAMSLVNSASSVDLAKMKYEEMAKAYFMNAAAGKYNNQQLAEGAQKVLRAKEQWEKLAQAQEESAKSSKSIGESFKELGSRFTKLFSGLTKLYQQAKRIAVRMLIRNAIKGLTSAFKEGLNNLYEWSKATGGAFGKALDEAKSKIQLLKNSLGAALAPVVQALIPLFKQLTSAIIQAANWFNQFISLITGHDSWTMAIENADDLAESTNNAAKANKELLASFDELNVISSGGGGGGGSTTTVSPEDFQEMYIFNEDVKNFVTWIKENLDAIVTTIGLAGAAFLAWQVSEAFAGTISTLASILGLVGVAGVTITLTWLLTNQYLDTGAEGWLIADALTTAVGSTIAWQLAEQALGAGTGAAAAAVTLTLSALVGITALLGDTDVSAVSKEGILTAVVESLKVGTAAGLLMGMVGEFTTGQAIGGGAVVALATLGVVIGIKTMIQAAQSDEITDEDLIGVGLSSLAMGLSVFTLAKLFTDLTIGQALGYAAGYAGATALLSLGVLVGIKATTKAVKNKEITEEVLGEDALASILAGGAVAVVAGLMSASIGTVLALAGGAAIVTFGALVGIQAILISQESDIEWGDVTLTEEQINDFVRGKMFTVDPVLTMELISSNIMDLTYNEQEIEKKINSLMGTLNVIKLGIASDNDYQAIKDQIPGVIESVNNWIKSAQNLDAIALKVAPSLFGDTDEERKNWYLQDSKAWSSISGAMEALGAELADLIVEGEGKELEVKRPERVAEILAELERISNIIAGSDIKTEALVDLNLSLKDLDETSFDKVMQQYNAYKDQLSAAANELVTSMEANKIRQIEALKELLEIDPDNEDLQNQLAEAEAALKDIVDNFDDKVAAAMDDMAEPGRSLLQEWVDKNFDAGSIDVDLGEKLKDMIDADNLLGALEEIFDDAGFDMDVIDINDLIEVGGWDLLSADLQKQVIDAMGGINNEGTIKKLKDELKMSADDIISISNWDTMTKEERDTFVLEMEKNFGSEATQAALEKLGKNAAGDIQDGLDTNKPNAEVTSSFAKDAGPDKLKEELKDLKGNAVVSAAVDPNATPTKAVTDNVDAYNKDKNKTKAYVEADVASTSIPKTLFDALMTQYNGDAEKVKAEIKACIEAGNDPTSLLTNEITSYNKDENKKSANFKTAIDSKNDIADSMKNGIGSYEEKMKTAKFKSALDDKNDIDDSMKSGIKSYTDNMKTAEFKSALKKKFGVTDAMKSNIKTYNDKPGTTNFKTAQKKGYGFADWQNKYQNTDPSISFKVEASNLKDFSLSFAQAVFQAIKAKLNGSKITIGQGGTINLQENVNAEKGFNNGTGYVYQPATYATSPVIAFQKKALGGIVSADLFIANENGKSEMIGRFGNQTAVANQDQMVEAMARGVSYAQAEQNSLLREQNRLLQGILEKEGSVKLGASSALGRTVRQSLNMYEAVVGV